MNEELHEINRKLDAILLWQERHDESHKRLDEHLAEVRSDVYGSTPESPGLKGNMRALVERCNRRLCGTKLGEWLFGASQQLAANASLAFIAWLLFVYVKHAI